ncbi:MAG: hypothetical protein KAR42_15235 [candidate division Zixibacteria bacterium]|nr:hypothetical protein [candidate division Zixibacteria bacterium]
MIRTDIKVVNRTTGELIGLRHYGPKGIEGCNIPHIISERERTDNVTYDYVSHISKEINSGGPGRGQGRKPKPLEERKARLTFTLSRSIAAWLELMAKKGHIKSRLVERALRKLKEEQ